jgi:hypothetical protein
VSNRDMHQQRGYTAQDSFRNGGLGVLIFMETHRRVCGGQFGSIPKPIKEWAFAEGGYCIDAPEQLPAGASEFIDLDPTGMEEHCDEFGHYGLPSQITVGREPS